jgi:hypothetical protein
MADSATDRTVLAIVDRIYEAVERPERWPQTIRDLGDCIGGRRDFWDLNPPTRAGDLVLSQACQIGIPARSISMTPRVRWSSAGE